MPQWFGSVHHHFFILPYPKHLTTTTSASTNAHHAALCVVFVDMLARMGGWAGDVHVCVL